MLKYMLEKNLIAKVGHCDYGKFESGEHIKSDMRNLSLVNKFKVI